MRAKRVSSTVEPVERRAGVMEASEYRALAATQRKPRGHPEEDFQKLVIDLARLNGWRCHYQPDWVHRLIRMAGQRGQRGDRDWPDRGWPDLILVRPPVLLIAELKSATGTLEPSQRAWIADLRACGVDVRVWKPKNEAEVRATLEGAGNGQDA
jgi:hypothetical protein